MNILGSGLKCLFGTLDKEERIRIGNYYSIKEIKAINSIKEI